MAVIKSVSRSSPAEKAGIREGDELLSINGHKIRDVLDFDFYGYDRKLQIELLRNGKPFKVVVKKPEGSELGLDFETYLMDAQRGCSNKCVFCFIDQLPRGMRKTLYFKDDDARLSFLLGNYISMTNLSDEDAERIIKMRISPLNISVHTTNPSLRSKMLGNAKGGESLKHLYAFCKAGLKVKAQIVACPGLNDGKELLKTITDLSALYPEVESVAVVPVGITRYRENLYPLTPVSKECAREMIKIIDAVRAENIKKYGCGVVCAADEMYLRASLPLPGAEYYEGFSQLENGVGLLASFEEELSIELKFAEDIKVDGTPFYIACGVAAEAFMNKCLEMVKNKYPGVNGKVIGVYNDFFGRTVDVSGLVCGRDLINRLKTEPKASRVLIPDVMLKHGETVFLDDVSVKDAEVQLGMKIKVCAVSGADFLSAVTGGNDE